MRRSLRTAVALAALAGATFAARAQTLQYRTLAGVKMTSAPDTGAIARAEQALAADPKNVDKIIVLGLAQQAVRAYREEIATFTRGIALAPNNPVLYRWRGHRYISTGQFDKALVDLKKGNKLDTMNYDIWYHLGVARFARGEFAKAADAFAHCQRLAPNPNETAGATDWLWMSLSRAGMKDQAQQALAPITDSLKITTATAYKQRLRLYRGLIGPDEVITPADTAAVQVATLSFGVGNWYLVRGETAKAKAWFKRSVESGGWPGFGFLLSERELRKMR